LEFHKLGVPVQQQPKLIVRYEGQPVGVFFPDFWIDQRLIIEVKAVKTLLPEHEAQLVHYLAATGIDNGLLINFSASVQVKRKFREFRSKDLPCAAFLAVSLE
jgi:GxxExxY protein